ncbi:unnamed protein product [Ilex paraguariensis]|uniref:ADP-ribosyl cyclase/cyclic ADP-ribose hydrolase n=1 Tax=Ilex paraguariensis TaxID=185542 RepID=A0ABC8T3V6_9AQUA
MAASRSRAQGASSSSSPCGYHVFLSFRGEDTRKRFADYLYKALVNAGFRTFRDEDHAERGEPIGSELKKAIQRSRSSVIVFSKDYASSTWCLDELVMILNRRRISSHFVLPVFYDVDPTHVRKQTGSFAEAFDGYHKRIEEEKDEKKKKEWMKKVKEWTEALQKVAELGGKVLINEADGALKQSEDLLSI